ncbi:uroporphyrinogen-III synthase [Sphingomonas xinjiangensis]|uniref:Uroporphyrinogen-III synthase n=1 Tax=Sphingomonas xinjiangensis TaxID=643568 RepID=A0A840YFT9_9SPHN|nr:uroporphyrinogen-III synthase [Sphingomonas xinjiangensis]MBB5711165.1 uroporphyrinogen-III synthase [Sphingomonas xinjiangensis]
MNRPFAVLRPEPGNRIMAAAAEARGRRVVRLPLFGIAPVPWDLPDPAAFDALILTSANAVRQGGAGLAMLRNLPVFAVGASTAESAERAGFRIAQIGRAGAAALVALAREAGVSRALHLAGRERTVEQGGIVADIRTVYASEALPIAPAAAERLIGSIALVQSARAGERLSDVVDACGLDRARIGVVAMSDACARAAGEGWNVLRVAPDPSPEALLDTAIALAD